MRLFVAVTPDEAVRAAAAAIQGELRSRTSLDARWVASERLHLTLAFLGSVDPSVLPDLRHALADALASVDGFTMRLGAPGAFPSARRPRILWLGVGQGAERLSALADVIRGALRPFSVAADDRPFRPHLTLARIRTPRTDRSLAASLASRFEGADASWEVRSVTLFESVLGPDAAHHRPEAVLALAGP